MSKSQRATTLTLEDPKAAIARLAGNAIAAAVDHDLAHLFTGYECGGVDKRSRAWRNRKR